MIRFRSLQFGCISIRELTLPRGRTVVMGPNGSGKTTLLRVLAGIDTPDEGDVLIDGKPPRTCETGWLPEFPDHSLLFFSVREEIASPLRFAGSACSQADARVEEVARDLGITHLLSRSTRHLSGGEKVLVALAAALAPSPDLLVLDEFDSHLDEETADAIMTRIRAREVPYVVHCTQNPDFAATADCLVLLQFGLLKLAGPPGAVFPQVGVKCYTPRRFTPREGER